MIIGHGDIASVLPERDDFLFFASGVSNSQETNDFAFKRELDLLLKQDDFKRIVYFSSLAVFYADTPYTRHKRRMEKAVKAFPRHNIIRIGNITWGTNPHTIINYFRDRVKNNEPIEVRDEYRYIVDKEEFLHWVSMIPDWNCEMNITGTRMSIKDIVNKYVYLGVRSI
jgi:nucleoside-diphosphate-sugar epimerase